MKKLLIAGLCLSMMLGLTTLAVAAEEDVAVTREYTETLHAHPTDDKTDSNGNHSYVADKFTVVNGSDVTYDVKYEVVTGTGDFNYTYNGNMFQIIGNKVEMSSDGTYIIYTTGPNGEVESQVVDGVFNSTLVGSNGEAVKLENFANVSDASNGGGDNAGVEEMVSAFCSLSFAGHSGVIMAAVLAGGCLVLLKRKDRR